jgi:hypothetical protein
LLNITIVSSFCILNSSGAAAEIDPEFGQAPIIDGIIDDSTGEWKEAYKNYTRLNDLPIDLWVMQTNQELFISIQLELEAEYHNTTEFFGILISANDSESVEHFVDAKFIQFYNISSNNFTYNDYYINNSIFLNDIEDVGNGAGKLDGDVSTYEFSLPIGQYFTNGNDEDTILNYKNSYAFNITYGDRPLYPEGILKSEIFLININPPAKKEIILTKLIFIIFSIIVFSIIGVLFGYYIYNIIKLKEKIERLRS